MSRFLLRRVLFPAPRYQFFACREAGKIPPLAAADRAVAADPAVIGNSLPYGTLSDPLK